MRWLRWCVAVLVLLHCAGAERPVQCGDTVLGGAEVCDDGNVQDGDGCSSTCTLEPGYMCAGFGRVEAGELGTGLQVQGDGTYALSGPAERCLGADVCAVGGLWQPELWSAYAPSAALPPRAFYCGEVCRGFGMFAGLQHDGACQLVDTDECVRGEAACDFNAVCENTAVGSGDGGLGYRCRCDRHFFALEPLGQRCAVNGVELVLRVIGAAGFDGQAVPPADMPALLTMRTRFLDHLTQKGVIKDSASRAALLEGLEGHEPALVEVLADPAAGFTGHALWAVKVRVALELSEPSVLMNLLSPDVGLDDGLDAVSPRPRPSKPPRNARPPRSFQGLPQSPGATRDYTRRSRDTPVDSLVRGGSDCRRLRNTLGRTREAPGSAWGRPGGARGGWVLLLVCMHEALRFSSRCEEVCLHLLLV